MDPSCSVQEQAEDLCNLAAAGQRLQIRHGAFNNVVMDKRRAEEEETMWLDAVEVEWTTESESDQYGVVLRT